MNYTLEKKVANIESKKYTEEEIQSLLEGYIQVHNSLWDYVPKFAHIRYVRKDKNNEKKTHAERFKPGGFVKMHFISEDKKMLMIETRRGGKQGDAGYITFPIAYEDIDELWKKYDYNSFIEIHLIYTSLMQKKKQIEELDQRVKKLETLFKQINK